jgi:hypothetical protein
MKDLDGDERPEFVYGGGGFLRFAKPDRRTRPASGRSSTISTQGPWAEVTDWVWVT